MTGESGELGRQDGRRQIMALLANTTVVLLLLTTCYYAVPLRMSPPGGPILLRSILSLVLLAAVAVVFRGHARRSRQALGKTLYKVQWLLSALYLLVLSFAMLYSIVVRLDSEQFHGIHDRTNALYYSVTIVGTVGFGDIYARGTLAQVLVTVQMLINLIYLGTALRLLSGFVSRGGGSL